MVFMPSKTLNLGSADSMLSIEMFNLELELENKSLRPSITKLNWASLHVRTNEMSSYEVDLHSQSEITLYFTHGLQRERVRPFDEPTA